MYMSIHTAKRLDRTGLADTLLLSSVHMSIHMSIHMYIHISTHASIQMSLHMSIHKSMHTLPTMSRLWCAGTIRSSMKRQIVVSTVGTYIVMADIPVACIVMAYIVMT